MKFENVILKVFRLLEVLEVIAIADLFLTRSSLSRFMIFPPPTKILFAALLIRSLLPKERKIFCFQMQEL